MSYCKYNNITFLFKITYCRIIFKKNTADLLWQGPGIQVPIVVGLDAPAGTPPNAIVFGSGYITIGQMVRAGIWVDVLSVTVVTLVATFLLPVIFGS